jgi:hypothetical protein
MEVKDVIPRVQVLRALGILVRHSPGCLKGAVLNSLGKSIWPKLYRRPSLDVQIAAAELLAGVVLVFQDSHIEERQKDPLFDPKLHDDALHRFCYLGILNTLRDALPSKAQKDTLSQALVPLRRILSRQLSADSAQEILDQVR